LRVPQPATLYLFLRSVRKLTRRFDSLLWEGDEQRVAKCTEILNDVEELLRSLDPDRSLSAEGDLEKVSTEIVGRIEEARRHIPSELTPIAVVRNLSFWARIAPAGPAKVAIIDDAEGLNEASRNAMLKILEEPPASVHFILIAERGQAVIETVRSRARTYTFGPRGTATERSVIERIFRDSDVDSHSLREYFLSHAGEQERETVSHMARRAAELIRATPGWERHAALEALAKDIDTNLGRNGYRGFFEELLRNLAGSVAGGSSERPAGGGAENEAPVGGEVEAVLDRRRVGEAVAEAAHRTEVLNMSLHNVLEDLMYKMEHHAEVH
ncbi:MAG: hypothetical protein ACOCYG_02085, partial [Spirochaetota bacterium]